MEIIETLYPVENTYRRCKRLDGVWNMALAAQGEVYTSGIPKQIDMIVPANINELEKSPILNTFSGEIWYERSFFVPKEWLGQDIYLRFEGVGSVFSVYVNGRGTGFHKVANTLHTIDITRYINYGEENRVTVRLEKQEAKSPKGILKSVFLYTVPPTRMLNYDFYSMQIVDGAVEINYEIKLLGNCLVAVILRNDDGSVVASGVGHRGKLRVEAPQLWNFTNRKFYKIEFEVSRLGKQCDAYSLNMPLYNLEYTDGKYYLNTEEINLRAIGVKYSIIPTLWHAKKAFAEIKAWGYNAIIFDEEVCAEKVLLAQKEGLLVLSQVLKDKIKNLNWWQR